MQKDDTARGDELPLRRKMLDAAQRLLDQAGGLSVTLEDLGLDKVIKEAGVSRTSVYREWENKEEFYIDLLCDLAGPSWQGTAAFDEQTILLARNVVTDDLSALASAEGRRQLLIKAVNVAAEQNYRAVITSIQWRTYVTLTATVLSISTESSGRARIEQALRRSEAFFLGKMADFYSDMAIVLGLRLRSYVPSYELLAAAGAAVVEGLALRQTLMPELVNQRIVIREGELAGGWHLAALGFLGVFDGMVESDPAYDLGEALPRYMKQLAEREVSARPGRPERLPV